MAFSICLEVTYIWARQKLTDQKPSEPWLPKWVVLLVIFFDRETLELLTVFCKFNFFSSNVNIVKSGTPYVYFFIALFVYYLLMLFTPFLCISILSSFSMTRENQYIKMDWLMLFNSVVIVALFSCSWF